MVAAAELSEIGKAAIPEPQRERIINGYNPKRSGDIQFTLKPGYFDGAARGTTHGAWNPYDATCLVVFGGV